MSRRTTALLAAAPALLIFSACGSSTPSAESRIFTLANALRACAVGSSCFDPPMLSLSDICSNFVAIAAQPDQLVGLTYGCQLAATTCAELSDCSMPSAAQLAGCGTSKTRICQGDLLVDCSGQDPVTDCSYGGLTCTEGSAGAFCGTTSCTSTFVPSCSGNTLTLCRQGGVVQTQCDDPYVYVQICGNDGGEATCVPPTSTCPASFEPTCAGTVVTNCSGGIVDTVDCAKVGATGCAVMGKQAICTTGTGAPCDDTMQETCTNGVISYCLAGSVSTLDCTSYGLSGCKIATSPGAGSVAACTP